MKNAASVILILFLVLAVCVSPEKGALASASSNDGIYAKSSTGPMVVRIQLRLRELGYLNFKPTGSYKSMTVDAAKAFQKNYRDSGFDMQVDGKMGEQSLELLFKFEALRPSLSSVSIPAGPKHGSGVITKTGSLVQWNDVKTLMKENTAYIITDCYTGYTFELVFTGGENHAEMEPASVNALAEFMRICGEQYNYLKRPVVVEIDGQSVAASIQCWPHGSNSIAENEMKGHVCLFFEGSLSHVGGLPDVEHNENIYKAAGQ